MRKLSLIIALLTLIPATARGAFPDDVVIQRLDEVSRSERQAKFDFVVRELSAFISGPPAHAVGSLGYLEFDFTFDNRVGFFHTDPTAGESLSAWDAVSEDGDAARVGYMPTFRFRKGLPWSFEIGMDVAWLAGTRQMAVGGYGRWAFLDGWRKVPDMALSLGYTGYIGNDQLDLGVFDLAMSIGYTFDVASSKEAVRPATRFSPFAGWQYLVATAAPSFVDVDEVDRVSGWVNAEDPLVGVDPLRFRYHRAFVGLQIGSGEVVVRMSGDFTFGKDAPVQVGFNLGVGVEF